MANSDPYNTDKKPTRQRRQSLNRPIQMSAEHLNLVLFGRSRAWKIQTANTILGQTEPTEVSETDTIHECVKREGVICGHQINLVKMPELYNTSLSQMDVMRETYKALSLCSSNIHAFLLVLPVCPLTDDDKGELTTVSSIFGTNDEKFWDRLMILFMCEGNRRDKVITTFIHKNGDIQKLIQKCGGKYHILSVNKSHDSEQVSELLQKTDAMIGGNKYVCYSFDMYIEAQLKTRVQQDARIKQMEKEIRELKEFKQRAKIESSNTNCLRIVLVGKTGNGKSATGNTILNKKVFKSELSSASVTSSCQKEQGIVNGMPVTVVDTPGLFDTKISNDEVKEEILKCISLLSPGPHVFLLVLTIGSKFTKEERETLHIIKETFGKNTGSFSIIIFTYGDRLRNKTIERYLETGDSRLQKLVQECGERYHVIDNTTQDNTKQVIDLLKKIIIMVGGNGGGCYTNEMFKEAEAAIQQEIETFLQKKKEEIERENKHLRDKHEREIAEMRRRMEKQKELMERERNVREDELKIKEEFLQNEIKRRGEQEEREQKDREAAKEQRRIEEERQQNEWGKKWKYIENKEAELERELQKRDQEGRERYEREKREMEERHKERLKREREQEEYYEKLNKEQSEWEKKLKKIIQEFDEEKKQREAAEKQRIEQERKERKKLEREFEKSKVEIRKQREEWEKSRKDEWDKRMREEEKRREEEREKLKKLQEAFEREREEEENKRKRKDQIRQEEEGRERKEMQEEYEMKLKEMKMKYEDEARKQAEEFNEFRQKYKKEFQKLVLKHDKQINQLKRTPK